jgi:hypothetical protein
VLRNIPEKHSSHLELMLGQMVKILATLLQSVAVGAGVSRAGYCPINPLKTKRICFI